MYTNKKIKDLIENRNRIVSELDHEIRHEIEKEKKRYKFSYKRFLLLLAVITLPIAMYKLNTKIFPKTSIWSWEYYIKNK